MLTSEQIREKFFNYWTSSPRNCKDIPSTSLVPNVDSTLLFVNSGMFPLAPYLAGQPHPQGTRLCDIQRCLRTNYDEMIEIGDNRHTLMFEMMGDWSLGDFLKKDQIQWIMEFWVEQCGFDPSRLYVTVFEGDEDAPRDDEAIQIWKDTFKKYGVEAEYSEDISNLPKDLEEGENWKPRIFPYSKKKNWWERAHAVNELGGPTSEMFYDLGEIQVPQDKYHVNDDSGRFIEIGNNVFMEYKLDENMKWQPLSQKNIDFGGGFERVVMIAQGKKDIFDTDIYAPIIEAVEKISGISYRKIKEAAEKPGSFLSRKQFHKFIWKEFDEKDYDKRNQDGLNQIQKVFGLDPNDENVIEDLKHEDEISKVEIKNFTSKVIKSFRVLADHSRAATFILADGVVPSNKDQGYILRRFIRRLIRYGLMINIEDNFTKELVQSVIVAMQKPYPHLTIMQSEILNEIEKEEIKFRKTVKSGILHIHKNYLNITTLNDVRTNKVITGNKVFDIYQTYGVPFEMTIEEIQDRLPQTYKLTDQEIEIISKEFNSEEQKHREQSRAGSEQKFKGGLADQSVETTKLHTAHHLLLAALQKIVDPTIKQRGSNITAERLRIDFNYNNKLTEDQIKQVEDLVNQKIQENLPVVRKEMSKDEAEKIGAQMEFGQKYGDVVSVYFIGDENNAFSKEFCGGPHVQNTSELAEGGKKFKILKEESSGSGIRRIKAALV